MENLKANIRKKDRVHEARQVRKRGNVPGILYGKNMANVLFEIGEMDLNYEISRAGEHGVINLNLNGENHTALIKEIQRDPTTRRPMHLDLEELSGDKIIHTDVPIIFNGEDFITKKGAVLQKEKTKVKIQCEADKVLRSINVEVGSLELGAILRLKDLEISKEIMILDNPDTVIATITDGNTNIVPNPTVAISNT